MSQNKFIVESKLTPWSGGFDERLRWGVDPYLGVGFCLRQMMTRRPGVQRLQHGMEWVQFNHLSREVDTFSVWAERDAHWAKAWQRREAWHDAQHTWPSGSYIAESEGSTSLRFFEADRWLVARADASNVSTNSVNLRTPFAAFKSRPMQWALRSEQSSGVLTAQCVGGHWQTYSRLPVLGSAQLQVTNFRGHESAHLSAVGLWLLPAMTRRQPPTSVQAQLTIGAEVYRFERWLPSATVEAPSFDLYRWLATAVNDRHRIEISADGGSPRLAPWHTWRDHRNWWAYKQAHMTTMSNVRVRVFPRGSEEAIVDLRAQEGLLMTLLPPS